MFVVCYGRPSFVHLQSKINKQGHYFIGQYLSVVKDAAGQFLLYFQCQCIKLVILSSCGQAQYYRLVKENIIDLTMYI